MAVYNALKVHVVFILVYLLHLAQPYINHNSITFNFCLQYLLLISVTLITFSPF